MSNGRSETFSFKHTLFRIRIFGLSVLLATFNKQRIEERREISEETRPCSTARDELCNY